MADVHQDHGNKVSTNESSLVRFERGGRPAARHDDGGGTRTPLSCSGPADRDVVVGPNR